VVAAVTTPRGKTKIHGPNTTGTVTIIQGPTRPGVHSPGATGGTKKTIRTAAGAACDQKLASEQQQADDRH
jgi:hypothetical protein